MNKPRYINSPSHRKSEIGKEIVAWLGGVAFVAAFFLGLIWLGLALTGGAR